MERHKLKTIAVLLIIIISITAVVAAKTLRAQELDLIKITLSATDGDNDTLRYSFSPPLNASGEWQTGYADAGIYTTQVAVSDGQSVTTQNITIIIENKNRAPIFSPSAITVQEGDKITCIPRAEDPDDDPLTYKFELPFNSQGEWQTSPNDAGTYLAKITISDSENVTEGSINITILNVDQAPQLELPPRLEVWENDRLQFTIAANDPDGDAVNITFPVAPADFQFEPLTKTFSWTPSFNTIRRRDTAVASILNAVHLDSFFLRKKNFPLTIMACAHDLCTVNSTTLLVYNANRPPVFENVSTIVGTENQPLKISVPASDPDGDIIHYSFSPPVHSLTGVWHPTFGDRGRYTIMVTARDGSAVETNPLAITVLPDNRLPQIVVDDYSVTAKEGETIHFSVKSKDADHDNVTLGINGLPAGASFQQGLFTWLIPRDFVQNSSLAISTLRFFASDENSTVYQQVNITVQNVNKAPQIVDALPGLEVTAYVHEPVLFQVHAADPDNDQLNYDWKFNFYEPEVIGTDTIERTFVTPGQKTVSVIISDGQQAVEKTWAVNVLAQRNLAPKISLDAVKVYAVEQ